jgi:hypothetical protein
LTSRSIFPRPDIYTARQKRAAGGYCIGKHHAQVARQNPANGRLVVYEGVSQIKAGEWSEITFKLTDYAAVVPAVETLKIWIKPIDNKLHEGDIALSVQSVTLHSTTGINVLSTVLWIILIVVIAAVVAFIGLVIRNQIRYRMRLRRQKQRAQLKDQTRRRQQQLAALPPGRLPPPSQTAARPGTQSADQPPRRPTGTIPRVSRTGRERRHRVPSNRTVHHKPIRYAAQLPKLSRATLHRSKSLGAASDPQASDLIKQ